MMKPMLASACYGVIYEVIYEVIIIKSRASTEPF